MREGINNAEAKNSRRLNLMRVTTYELCFSVCYVNKHVRTGIPRPAREVEVKVYSILANARSLDTTPAAAG